MYEVLSYATPNKKIPQFFEEMFDIDVPVFYEPKLRGLTKPTGFVTSANIKTEKAAFEIIEYEGAIDKAATTKRNIEKQEFDLKEANFPPFLMFPSDTYKGIAAKYGDLLSEYYTEQEVTDTKDGNILKTKIFVLKKDAETFKLFQPGPDTLSEFLENINLSDILPMLQNIGIHEISHLQNVNDSFLIEQGFTDKTKRAILLSSIEMYNPKIKLGDAIYFGTEFQVEGLPGVFSFHKKSENKNENWMTGLLYKSIFSTLPDSFISLIEAKEEPVSLGVSLLNGKISEITEKRKVLRVHTKQFGEEKRETGVGPTPYNIQIDVAAIKNYEKARMNALKKVQEEEEQKRLKLEATFLWSKVDPQTKELFDLILDGISKNKKIFQGLPDMTEYLKNILLRTVLFGKIAKYYKTIVENNTFDEDQLEKYSILEKDIPILEAAATHELIELRKTLGADFDGTLETLLKNI